MSARDSLIVYYCSLKLAEFRVLLAFTGTEGLMISDAKYREGVFHDAMRFLSEGLQVG